MNNSLQAAAPVLYSASPSLSVDGIPGAASLQQEDELLLLLLLVGSFSSYFPGFRLCNMFVSQTTGEETRLYERSSFVRGDQMTESLFIRVPKGGFFLRMFIRS